MNSLIHLLAILLLVCSLPIVFGSSAKFQGTLLEGIDQSQLRRGGAFLTVQLIADHFQENLNEAVIKNEMRLAFLKNTSIFDNSFPTASCRITNRGKTLRIQLGPNPTGEIAASASVQITIPGSLLLSGNDIVGPSFYVLAQPTLRYEAFPQLAVVGKKVTLLFSSPNARDLGADFRITEGSSCAGSKAPLLQQPLWESENSLTLTPRQGGRLSVCYLPTDGNFTLAATSLIRAIGDILISGPEGVSIDPPHPHALMDVTLSIYGTNLTEEDLVAVTDGSCLGIIEAHAVYDISFSSASRTFAYITAPTEGVFNVCYLREGSPQYTWLASLVVQPDRGGNSLVVDSDTSQLVVTEDTRITRPIHIRQLTVESGTLDIENHQLNITTFVWIGGKIVGTGTLNCMGSHSSIAGVALEIQSHINNFGTMTLEASSLSLEKHGAIHNFGKLLLIMNATTEQPALITSEVSSRNFFYVSMGAHLSVQFRDADEEGGLLFAAPLENKGVVAFALNGKVALRNFRGAPGCIVLIGNYSTVGIESGEVSGKVLAERDGVLHLFQGPVKLVRALISGNGATMRMSAGSYVFDSVAFSDVNLAFDGSTPRNSGIVTELFGHNYFDADTVTALREISFASSSLSYLSFDGKLLCHIPSVSFGDNVIINSRLSAVMFGDGTQSVKLIPQRMPRNSSFIIPPNATLVIMDTGNSTEKDLRKAAIGPQLCSQYLIVPMHVEFSGKILLWGCAMFPFGGTHQGVIFGAAVAEIASTVQYAFCHSVLRASSSLCVPVFENNNAPLSGIALGGNHVLSLPGQKSLPAVDLDYFETLPLSQIVGENPLNILARRGITIHTDSRLVLPHGGWVATNVLTVYGIVEATSDAPLVVDGDFEVFPDGQLIFDTELQRCSLALSVRDQCFFHTNSSVHCGMLLNGTGSSALLEAGKIRGMPLLDERTCVPQSLRVSTVGDETTLGLQVVSRYDFPSLQIKIVATIGMMILGALLFAGLCFRQSISSIVSEFRSKHDFTLYLSWPEFSCFRPNFLAVGMMFTDALLLASPSFHSGLPLPAGMRSFTRLSTSILSLHKADFSSPVAFLAIEFILIGIWAVAWIPLAGKKISNQLKRLLHHREEASERYAIQLLFEFHTIATMASSFAFIPALSWLMDTISCEVFESTSNSCSSVKGLALPAVVFTALFAYLTPYSGSCSSFPFLHPPYQRDLDIRFKRVFLFLRFTVYFVMVGTWKIFSNDALSLVISSLVVVLLLLISVQVINPCAYRNINTLLVASLLYPLWSMMCALVQVLRFGNRPSFLCAPNDPIYIVLLFAGWASISVCLFVLLKRCASAGDILARTDATLAANIRGLMRQYSQIEELKTSMYNTGNSRERERISDQISAYRIQYLHLLNKFRRRKERFLLPYYLGDHVGGSLMNEFDRDDSETIEASFDVPMKTMKSTDEEVVLSAEQMEHFIRGPQLGRGSYGVVHMGMLPCGKLVAVKDVEISRKKRDALTAVKKEVNMLRSLVHDNVIRYYGCHSTGRQMHVFMEFAVGGSLTSLVRKFEKLSEPVMRLYTYQILEGLKYLHSKGVVHRDIKGENILIDGQGVAKVADFGCSKALADIANKSQAGCGTLVGSPYWMAPEVIKSEAYGTKADIWSVGCTVVEMLNGGDPPWHQKFDNVYSAMFFIGNTTEIPSNVPDDVSHNCRDFLAKCFERDVSKRPSAEELLLHSWIGDVGAEGAKVEAGMGPREWSDMFQSDATDVPSAQTTLQSPSASQQQTSTQVGEVGEATVTS